MPAAKVLLIFVSAMKPTQFGKAYAKTMVSCPLEISGYGRCVIANKDGLEKGTCHKEFQQLMKCFEKVSNFYFYVVRWFFVYSFEINNTGLI